jgi:pimeloyl-ACP methyl ester carboxylesterase
MSALEATAPLSRTTEPTRARYPDEEGFVERDGVRVFYEVYGEGQPTIVLVPGWSLVHARMWKPQIPYLARHFRVIAFDPRGNGRSDRPSDPGLYGQAEVVGDVLQMLDSTGTDRVVLVGDGNGAQQVMLFTAEHPDRVLGAALIAPFFPISRFRLLSILWRLPIGAFERPGIYRWFGRFNANYWRRDWPGFVEWWFARAICTPHSTRQIEQSIEWSLETDPETMIAAARAPIPRTRGELLEPATRIHCPTLVIHGDNDRIIPLSDARALARRIDCDLKVVHDGAHAPAGRKPVEVNLALREFVDALGGVSPPAAPPAALARETS